MLPPEIANQRYVVREVIGRGVTGVVYRAYDNQTRREVAIKTLFAVSSPGTVEWFRRGFDVSSRINHPNIAEIDEAGHIEVDGVSRPFLAMPLLHGVTLDRLIRASSTRLTVERSIDIVCQACRGLQAAHEKGMVHGDIKPDNIFVLEDDSVKVIGFDRLEGDRAMGRKGTLLYMAPEQIEMRPLSAASDIFSLGVVCYETLTNRRPFERGSQNLVADAILHYIPAPASELNSSVNRAISQAIHKAMAKQPWHRYATAREFAETLQKALRNDPIEIFDPRPIQPRLQRAAESLERGDYQFASEIVEDLEAEGHLDPAIRELRGKIDEAIRSKTMAQLLETARSRMEEDAHPLALQKLHEILQLDPAHPEALTLKTRIETQRTQHEIDEWFQLAGRHAEGHAFARARQALQHVLQLRPEDGRALQLLAEVDRQEQEFLRARQEKEELYRAAVEAGQRGDLTSALSKLERVLDLDRRMADPTAPERAAAYQSLYQQVRSEQDAIQRTYADARHQLDACNFSAALALCTDQLAKYPKDALFQALKLDIEEKSRQTISARIAETDGKIDAEPDLDRRITILEEAVRAFPGEPHFQQLLQHTRDKYNLIESIAARARLHEQQTQFREALSQWEILKTIYDRYPGLDMEIDRVARRREQHLRGDARNRWTEQIDRSLEGQDYDRARELLARAQVEHPGDSELAQLEILVRQGLEKTAEAQRLLDRGQYESAAGRHQESIDTLKQAYQLDDRNPAIRSAFRDILIGRARKLLHSDPLAAELLLRQVLEFETDNASARSLLNLIAERREKPVVQPVPEPVLEEKPAPDPITEFAETGPVPQEIQPVDPDAETIFDPLTVQTPPVIVRPVAKREPAPPVTRSEQVPPDVVFDRVHFTITAPSGLEPGQSFELLFWAHLEKQRGSVIRRALLALGVSSPERMLVKSEGPLLLARGTVVSASLVVEGFAVEPKEKAVAWSGEAGCAGFVVTVPARARKGPHRGVVSIRVNSCQIARMDFVLTVKDTIGRPKRVPARMKKHRKAFASYASEDRDAVLARVQGMQKVAPWLKVFLDVEDLRSGQRWGEELHRMICDSDIFYLFWCRHASASEWVEKEWRCAYENLGIDFIDPVPLEPPDGVPPPKELAVKHFNDPWLAFMGAGAHE
jgi:serine/threonine-protein kinase